MHHEHDAMESMMVDVGTPGIDRGEDDYVPGDEYMPGVDDDAYVLHYVSADVDLDRPNLLSWSVYRERYAALDDSDQEPIAGSTVRVSTHLTEAEAYAEADRLQVKANPQ